MTARGSTQAQLDAMNSRIDALAKQLADDLTVRTENHAMLSQLHSALMVPQPGQDGKSLLGRMADVTVDIESGKRSTDNLIGIARRLAAVGAFIAVLAASLKFGEWPSNK